MISNRKEQQCRNGNKSKNNKNGKDNVAAIIGATNVGKEEEKLKDEDAQATAGEEVGTKTNVSSIPLDSV